MKRAKSLFNQIISYENVRLAWIKARRHKTSKNVVKNFSKNVNKNLLIVQKNLKSKPAILSSYSQFTIYEPKERLISVVPFIDRVMHHAIMNVLEPVFEKQFIFHTYACRCSYRPYHHRLNDCKKQDSCFSEKCKGLHPSGQYECYRQK